MTPAIAAPQGTRLRQLLVLLLLSIGLLAGVSVLQTQDLHGQVLHADQALLPMLKQVHALARQVDEQRGMAALHLTLPAGPQRTELEARLQAGRQQIERRMAAFGRQLQDDTDRAHHHTVAAALATFWDVQDRLLAASRQAAADPAAAQRARSLLTGDAQQAFLQLRAEVDAWWAYTEAAAAQQAQQARVAAHLTAQVVWALAALVALALPMAWALLRTPQPGRGAGVAPGVLADGDAARAHLQALNAAVAAARRGEPGRAAGLSAHEARLLAEQVAAAAQGLRRLIDRPPPAGTGMPDAATIPTGPVSPGAADSQPPR